VPSPPPFPRGSRLLRDSPFFRSSFFCFWFLVLGFGFCPFFLAAFLSREVTFFFHQLCLPPFHSSLAFRLTFSPFTIAFVFLPSVLFPIFVVWEVFFLGFRFFCFYVGTPIPLDVDAYLFFILFFFLFGDTNLPPHFPSVTRYMRSIRFLFRVTP